MQQKRRKKKEKHAKEKKLLLSDNSIHLPMKKKIIRMHYDNNIAHRLETLFLKKFFFSS